MDLRKLLLAFFLFQNTVIFSQFTNREHIKFDEGWRFAFGHPYDTKKDFNNGTGYFSYLTKTGYGDGAAAAAFDDRAWRKLDLPHDWAVEQPFSEKASYSHGFKAVGRNFPGASVGWYRKTFAIAENDKGKRISIAFDGIFRNSIFWVNGHYLGTNPSGYLGVEYDISDYLNYGGDNVIAVRVDATMEEGWFYEGAGIYRHAWLNKTNKLHILPSGCYADTKSIEGDAKLVVHASVKNESSFPRTFDINNIIKDGNGNLIQSTSPQTLILKPYEVKDVLEEIVVANAKTWSIDDPYLYRLATVIKENGTITDSFENNFGIRSIRFDASQGFFLNGKPVKIHGTNNHQDHAGVGVAMPDSLIVFRLKQLQAFGNNAYRCSHNPPAPELLDACDRMGILVIDENRLMGITSTHLEDVKRMIDRDRHHPSIISWSIGNEEWNIEGNATGAAIASTMQNFVKSMDTTRAVTAAVSGGWRKGISNVIDVMGYNYIGQINTDEHHAEFPNQPSWGTEEGSTRATRGVYETDDKKQLIAAYDKKPFPNFYSIEEGWKHYASRPYLAGMFIWTGFDYRGEPTPYGWPSVGSYFGMLDQCGFPKDNYYYLRSWWTNNPTLHILPHWNHDAVKEVDVWVYSNCDEVELVLNKKSLGRKPMAINSHLEWKVKFQPGTMEAIGYKKGRKVLSDKVQTTGAPATISLETSDATIESNKESVAVVTVSVKDKNGLQSPVASGEILFSVKGPGKIIGVGNGDPTSLEADKYLGTINIVPVNIQKEKAVATVDMEEGTAADYNDASWAKAFIEERNAAYGEKVKAIIYRGDFMMPAGFEKTAITFFSKILGNNQSIFINGKKLAGEVTQGKQGSDYIIPASWLHAGKNSIAIVASPLLKKNSWDVLNEDAGVFSLVTPAGVWKRKLFNGLAQVIIQSTSEPGEIMLNATSGNLRPASLNIQAK
jgi:beta-galactosidase